MGSWILEQFNKLYLPAVLRFAKWTMAALLIVFLLIGVGAKFVMPKIMKSAAESSKTTVVGSGDESRILYKDNALPKDYASELATEAPMLIYENQLRSTRNLEKPDEQGRPEDGPPRPAGIQVSLPVRAALTKTSDQFLRRWETFDTSTSLAAYRSSLAPYVEADALPAVAERKDSFQNEAIAPGGNVGWHLQYDGYTPAPTLVVRRYNGDTAYVTMLGEVATFGPGLIMRDVRYLRSYALLLKASDGEWKVTRAAAQTLSQIL